MKTTKVILLFWLFIMVRYTIPQVQINNVKNLYVDSFKKRSENDLSLNKKHSICFMDSLKRKIKNTKLENHSHPSFNDYFVKRIYKGTPAKVDFSSNSDAKEFKSVLRETEKSGPNFAGHYTMVEWGCGTSCQDHAIINTRNGHVFFPARLVTTAGIDFKLNSSMLITDPIDTAYYNYYPSYSYYYNWNGKKLILIDSSKIYHKN